ncbi:hypothetical protein G7046_g9099 [Stylonectria norvegica]|nr:hypothetical protein G7046_g9099 [Stylonectria norvegica]
MLSITQPADATLFPLGQRRGISDLARIALDLTWAPQRSEYEASARSRAYPSPPMSGSPPLPPKATREVGNRGRATGGYLHVNTQHVYQGTSNQQSPIDHRGTSNMPPSLPRIYQQEPVERLSYPYQRPEEPLSRSQPYPQPGVPGIPQQQGYLPAGGSGAAAPYAVHSRPPAPDQQMSSPKSQRKPKGHVASACVPSQRPCSRCLSNGKEESCVDVQHKKRGRPRLRDDRDARYDPSRFPHPQDVALMRPLSIYPSGGSMGSGYEDPLRRVQSFRVLKSQPSEPLGPRFLDRASAPDANVYAAPLSIATRQPEPVAFLTMKLEFAKASPIFVDAIGGVNLQGRNLSDIVMPAERDKVSTIRGQLLEEQTRKEPNYLPPILGRLDHIIQGLGFGAEDIGRYQLERQEYLAFCAADGTPRSYPVRIGLAKEGSIYFVVLFLNVPSRYPYPSPSPHSRDAPQAYHHPQPPTPQSAYGQHAPASATFDPSRHRYNDGSLASRPAPGPPTQMPTNISPGVGLGAPSYSASPSRPDFSGPSSYQIPRSELPATRPAPQPSFQLPPIRAQPDYGPAPGEQSWNREDRSSRVDIGGLIEKPETTGRPQ